MSVTSRTAAILRVLAEARRPLSLAEIAQRVSLPRSSVHRLIRELHEEHLVMAAASRRGYWLGPGLLKLAVASQAQLVAPLRPVMFNVARRVQENVDLAVLSGREVVVIEQVSSSERRQAVTAVGAAFAPHASALGKVLLAQCTDDEIRALLPETLERFTENTIVDVEDLIAGLEQVRRTGIGEDREEHDLGICAVAMLVRSSSDLAPALSVVAPVQRFERNRALYVAVLREAVRG